MEPKIRDSYELRHNSDVWHGFAQYRNRQTLHRSTGHRFRDGRWAGSEDQFYQRGVIDSPGFGSNRTFDGSTYWLDAVVPPNGTETHHTYNWRPTVGRSFTITADTSYDMIAPDTVDPPFEDMALSLNAEGTSFIRRYRPGNPALNLGQFIIELRDLPRIPIFLERRAKAFKDLGSEYLNIEFGWKPFIKDCLGVYQLQKTIKDRYDRLIRDNGLTVRKRTKKVESTDTTVNAEGTLSVPFGHLGDLSKGGAEELEGVFVVGPFPYFDPNSAFTGSSEYIAKTETKTVVWSRGDFRYYVPDIGSDQWTGKFIATMFGAIPTPSQLYSVFPWTWLIDWFSNVGDIVSNLSANAVENETLTNCFTMRREIETRSVAISCRWDELNFAPFEESNGTDVHAFIPSGTDRMTYVVDTEAKYRQQASPYGFGIPKESFSARQWAILAALAVSR